MFPLALSRRPHVPHQTECGGDEVWKSSLEACTLEKECYSHNQLIRTLNSGSIMEYLVVVMVGGGG